MPKMPNLMSTFRGLPAQAQAVLVVGLLSVAYVLVQMLGLRGEKRKLSVMVLAASVLAVVISTYNIRCLVTGKCFNWATLLAVAYVLTQGSALISMF